MSDPNTSTARSLRIRVVTPLPVSGIEGGNERHWRSLTAALRAAGHDADLIAEVSPEADLHEVLASYAMFHRLDVSDADVVISGKYPSFMVRHPRHIRHLNHTLRGLYEHYPADLPVVLPDELTSGIARWGDDVEGLIDWADRTARSHGTDPVMAFPGPFARAVVQRLDRIARDRLAAEATVSETVANRPGYVDPARPISVIPPLGDLTLDDRLGLTPAVDGDDARPPFLFTFGRLDRAKRVDLILRSFAMARRLPGMGDAELIVAGEGPLADELASQAGPGVRLVGRLDDETLGDHLHRARAVVLAPIDEDYGLVAAEAMAAGTPVLATSDSGGIAEQVTHGRNGLVVHPRSPLLAKAMRDLIVDGDLADRMGRAARDAVADISWTPMLSLIDEVSRGDDRPNVLLVSTFPADPVENGGQRRLRGMAAGLATHGWTPTVLSLTNRLEPGRIRRRRTDDGVRHVMVGRSERHLAADFSMATLLGTPIDDVAASELWPASPAFEPELRVRVDDAEVVILSHPFLASAVAAVRSDDGPPVVYDAFNVEADLKRDLVADRDGGAWVAARAARAEAAAIDMAALVSATSTTDLDRFRDLGLLTGPAVTAVNPVDPGLTRPVAEQERAAARRRFLLDRGTPHDERPIALFVGSDHPPNRTAARRCALLAAARPDIHVVIAGAVTFEPVVSPFRPTVVGSFPPADLRRLHAMADVVLNPVDDGSGTSLKLVDPLSLGIPVVSTAIGARGVDDPADVVWLAESEASSLAGAIDRCLADEAGRASRVARGFAVAELARPHRAMADLAHRLAELTGSPADS